MSGNKETQFKVFHSFEERIGSDASQELSIRLSSIAKETPLEDILNEVRKIYSKCFSD